MLSKKLFILTASVYAGRNEIINMVQNGVANTTVRSGSFTVMTNAMRLVEDYYGCWCRFEQDPGWSKGKGQPIDEFDSGCKDLNRGYACLQMDYPSCDVFGESRTNPTDALYVSPAITGSETIEQIRQACIDNNPMPTASGPERRCRQDTCVVESNFVVGLMIQLRQGNLIEDSYQHGNGFEPRSLCLAGSNGGQNGVFETQCCGTYPDKFPFKTTKDGIAFRGCCGERTYFVDRHCCKDDSVSEVAPVGTC